MTTCALLALAESKQHEVIYVSGTTVDAFSVEVDKCYIALSTDLSGTKEKEKLAHELGHCEYGGFYNVYSKYEIRNKAERRADKWAFMHLLPIGEVREACERGFCEVWEIAEHFGVSCEFATKAIRYYQSVGLM